MTVTVDLGTAKDFMYWDADTQDFKINEDVATELYVGTHTICMNVAHFNETYREEYNDCFKVTIRAPDVVVPKWTPPEKVEGQLSTS